MSMWFSPLCLLVVLIKVKLPHHQRLGEKGSFFLMNAPDFPCGSAGKESACSEGDLASIPGLRRSPVRGKGYTLQYFGLENSKHCIVHGGHKQSDMTDQLSLSLFKRMTPRSLRKTVLWCGRFTSQRRREFTIPSFLEKAKEGDL